MARYVGRRMLTGLLTVLFCLAFNFALIRLAPGDPINIMAGVDNPNPEMIAALTEKYGLDKSIPEQFASYLEQLVHFDLGYSYLNNRSVIEIIQQKIGPSLMLTLTAILSSVVIGTLLGVVAARKNGCLLDRLMCSVAYVFDSLPSFWLGLMMILIFASTLKIFPTSGMYDVRAQNTGFAYVLDVLYHLALPVITLILVQIPYYFRIARSSVIQVMADDFIVTYRAAGMDESKIFFRYVLKNAIIPTVTVFGMSLAFMITGSTLVETVFAWPGIGRVLLDSIYQRDYPVLSGIYLMLSVSVAVMMILVDLVYAWIDPRIRYE